MDWVPSHTKKEGQTKRESYIEMKEKESEMLKNRDFKLVVHLSADPRGSFPSQGILLSPAAPELSEYHKQDQVPAEEDSEKGRL